MLRILIADNEALTRALIRKTLSVIPACSFIEANDGIAAMKQIQHYRPTLIFLDMAMPEMNGTEVCRLIKSDPCLSTEPTIVIVASPDLTHRVLARDAGCDGFLRKPVNEEELLATVMYMLQRHRIHERTLSLTSN